MKKFALCATCYVPMTHPIGRGKASKYCSDTCRASAATLRKQLRVLAQCSVEGCDRQANRVGAGLCEVHYCRRHRTGTTAFTGNALTGDREHSNGYVLVEALGHPMALEGYRAYAHRVAYFDAHGNGPFSCHWCKLRVSWNDMHVDHLDDDKKNNDPKNLVASCPTCNQARGQPKMRAAVRGKYGVEVNGIRRTLAEWASLIGIGVAAMRWRIGNGWPLHSAVTVPRGKTGPRGWRDDSRRAALTIQETGSAQP